MSLKKKSLLDRKEKLLAKIRELDESIEDFQRNTNQINNVMFEDDSSSDSDVSFHENTQPSMRELKNKHSLLNNCLQATQELTKLEVLQSEVNLLSETPVLEGEEPVECEGVWREVIADCRIKSVPFLISFYVHKPYKKFAPLSYRGLSVVPNKDLQKDELNDSILMKSNNPSDVTEVIRNYSVAYLSRKTTLDHLVQKYGRNIVISPLTEGGCNVKYKDFFEVSWVLQNNWSIVAPFIHSFKFVIGFLQENYVKRIQMVHKKLSDPTLETNERTQLLKTMIDICIEAKGVDESQGLESDQEPDRNMENSGRDIAERTDKEVMAPPKSLPKKGKPKGKENEVVNKNKRLNPDNNTESIKKVKLSDNSEAGKRTATKNLDKNKNINTDKGEELPADKNKNVAQKKVFDKNLPKSAEKSKKEGPLPADKTKNVGSKKVSQQNSANSLEKGKKINADIKGLPAKKNKEVTNKKVSEKNLLTVQSNSNKNVATSKELTPHSAKAKNNALNKNSKADDNIFKPNSAKKVVESAIVHSDTNKKIADINKNVALIATSGDSQKNIDQRPILPKENINKKKPNSAAKKINATSNNTKRNPKIVANKLDKISKAAKKPLAITQKKRIDHHKITKNKIPIKSTIPSIINKQKAGNTRALSNANKHGGRILTSKIPQKKTINTKIAVRLSQGQNIASKLKTVQHVHKAKVQKPNSS